MNQFIRVFTLTAMLSPTCFPAAGDDLAVIINKANPATNLTKSQLRKLVLAEQESWPSGQKVIVVLRAPGVAERDGTLRSVCRMSEDDYNQHVMHSSFGGSSAAPPKVLASGVAVRQFVASSPGAVGFVRLADVDSSVKVISVEGISAGQPEYKIKTTK